MEGDYRYCYGFDHPNGMVQAWTKDLYLYKIVHWFFADDIISTRRIFH